MYSKHVQFNTWSNEPPPLSENIPIPYNRHVRQPPIRNLPQPITKQFQNQQPNLARHPLEQGFEIILEALKQIQTRLNTIEKKQADPGIAPNYPTLPIKMINTKPTIPNLTNAIPQKNQRYLPNPQQPTTDIPFHKNQHYQPNLQQPTTGIPFQKNQHYQLNPNQQHHQPYPQRPTIDISFQGNQHIQPNLQQPTTDIPFKKNQHPNLYYQPNLQHPTTDISFQKNQHNQPNQNQYYQPKPQLPTTDILFQKNQHNQPNQNQYYQQKPQLPTTDILFQKNQLYQPNPEQLFHPNQNYAPLKLTTNKPTRPTIPSLMDAIPLLRENQHYPQRTTTNTPFQAKENQHYPQRPTTNTNMNHAPLKFTTNTINKPLQRNNTTFIMEQLYIYMVNSTKTGQISYVRQIACTA
jgi:hypothetical protein